MRSIRKQPFCWQEKKILRLLRRNFKKLELSKLRNLYLTISEMDSDFNGKDIKYYTNSISTYSGLSKEWIPSGLKILEKLQMIEIIEEKEKGKFKGKKLVFTPDNVIEMSVKTVPGKTFNGKTVIEKTKPLEDILLLENSNYKEDKEEAFSKEKENSSSIKNISISIKKILSIVKEKGNFSTLLPIGTKLPSATVLKSVQFIECLQSGFIEREYVLDHEWLSKNKINLTELNGDILTGKLESCLVKAATRFGKMRKEGNWPYDKSKMTKSIEDWLYNPRTKKSWFLYCLFNHPKSINYRFKKEEDKDVEEIDFSEETMDLFISRKMLKKEWTNLNLFWKKAIEIENWYEKIKEGYNIYHIYESGDWNGVCGNIKKFLDKYKEFIDTWETWNIGNFGLNNATWKKFIIYMREKYNIILDISDRSLQKALEYHKRESGK